MSSKITAHIGNARTNIGDDVLAKVWEQRLESYCFGVEVGRGAEWDIPKDTASDARLHTAVVKAREILESDKFYLKERMVGGCIDLTAILYKLYKGIHVAAYDLGHGLHPNCFPAMIEAIREALSMNESARLTCIVYNPLVVNELKGEEVWVHARDKGGQRWSAKLAGHKQFGEIGNMPLGEFWLAKGEEWAIIDMTDLHKGEIGTGPKTPQEAS